MAGKFVIRPKFSRAYIPTSHTVEKLTTPTLVRASMLNTPIFTTTALKNIISGDLESSCFTLSNAAHGCWRQRLAQRTRLAQNKNRRPGRRFPVCCDETINPVKSGWAPSPPTFNSAFLHMGLQCLPAKVCYLVQGQMLLTVRILERASLAIFG